MPFPVIGITQVQVAELHAQTELLLDHHNECEARYGRELNVQWSNFYRLESLDLLRIYAVWNDGGDEMLGYVVGIYTPGHLHHSDWHTVTVNAIYVAPAVRRADVTDQLMNQIRGWAKEVGAHSIMWQAKCGSQFDLYLDRKLAPLERTYEEKL